MRFSAIAIGFFLGFVVPAGVFYSILLALGTAFGPGSSVTLQWFGLLWVPLLIVSPVVAGYISARIGQSRPLLHGFIIGALATTISMVAVTPWFGGLALALVLVPGGIFGAWLWRRSRKGAIESAP